MTASVYESIVLLYGDEALAALDMVNEKGEAAAAEYLKQWHEPGEGTLVSSRDDPWKPGDGVYEHGQYVLYYNPEAPYIGLVCRVEPV